MHLVSAASSISISSSCFSNLCFRATVKELILIFLKLAVVCSLKNVTDISTPFFILALLYRKRTSFLVVSHACSVRQVLDILCVSLTVAVSCNIHQVLVEWAPPTKLFHDILSQINFFNLAFSIFLFTSIDSFLTSFSQCFF